MSSIICPSCGAELKLLSPASIFVVCSYCRSTLIHDRDWTSVGVMADLPPDMSVFQIGTKGQALGENFELIGRRRMQWSDGFWTEWCARLGKGKAAWLAEAQGLLMFSQGIPLPSAFADDLRKLTVGTRVRGANAQDFVIDDCKEARCIASEGELPFLALPAHTILSIDGSNSASGFINFEEDLATGERRAFQGRYMDFAEFNFQNLRKLDGW